MHTQPAQSRQPVKCVAGCCAWCRARCPCANSRRLLGLAEDRTAGTEVFNVGHSVGGSQLIAMRGFAKPCSRLMPPDPHSRTASRGLTLCARRRDTRRPKLAHAAWSLGRAVRGGWATPRCLFCPRTRSPSWLRTKNTDTRVWCRGPGVCQVRTGWGTSWWCAPARLREPRVDPPAHNIMTWRQLRALNRRIQHQKRSGA